MLVLTRKLMEKLFIGDDICVTVVRLEGGQVRLGIDAPRDIRVIRGELTQRSAPAAPVRRRAARAAPPPGPVADHASLDHSLTEPVADAADRLDKVGRFARASSAGS